MILDKLAELQPVRMQQAAAAIMPFIPFSYTARLGNDSAFRAARVKLHSLKECNRIDIIDSVVTVRPAKQRAKRQQAPRRTPRKVSGVQQCINELNATGQCDTSAIWSNEGTAKTMKSIMRALGWIPKRSKGSVVSFIGEQPASLEQFNEYKYRQRK
jgi:hypothetical protein